jgi:large subunit ribosomal protein L24
MANMKIKKGDQVRVISGKEAGKTAKVSSVDTEKRRVVLERLNIESTQAEQRRTLRAA